MVDELPVARMIHCLDGHDFGYERWCVAFDVLDELGFCIRRAGDKYGTRISNRLRERCKKT